MGEEPKGHSLMRKLGGVGMLTVEFVDGLPMWANLGVGLLAMALIVPKDEKEGEK